MAAVVVDGLLAEENQRRGVAPRKSRDYVRHSKRLHFAFVHHVRGTVSAQSQTRAQHVACARRADGNGVHAPGDAALLEAQRLLERNLTKRVHRELDAFEVNALQHARRQSSKERKGLVQHCCRAPHAACTHAAVW